MEGRAFQFSFPLPGRKRRKSKPEKDDRARRPDRKTKSHSKEGNQAKPDTPATTKTDSKEYDRTSSQTTERKEYRRTWQQNSRHEAKGYGLCTECKEKPPIPSQTRCQKCAEKHRAYREKALQNPEARGKWSERSSPGRGARTQRQQAEKLRFEVGDRLENNRVG